MAKIQNQYCDYQDKYYKSIPANHDYKKVFNPHTAEWPISWPPVLLHVMPLAKLLVTIFKNAKLPSRP
jgi:hypothetical protein